MTNPIYKAFGLAISNTALTAVEISHGKFGLKVVNYSRIELEPGIIEDNCIIINDKAFKDALNKLLLNGTKGPIKAQNVIISIPEEKTFTHRLCIPKEHYNDDDYIYNEAKNFIPITLDEAIVDYQIVKSGCTDNKSLTYNFVATQKSIVDPLIQTLKDVNLDVVGIDTNNDSLMRSCDNRYQKNKGDFMVIYVNSDRTTISIGASSEISYNASINIGGKEFSKNIQTVLQGNYDSIVSKINELIKIISNKKDLKIETIYLIGSGSAGAPGLIETIQKNYPETEIKQKLDYIETGEETEIYYSHAIGLALKDVIGASKEDDINLLPSKRREEIETAKMTPKVMKYSFLPYLTLVILLLLSGRMITDSYLNFKISEQEVGLYEEKIQNPYLTEVAKATQQKRELEKQIFAITSNTFPISTVIEKMDDYNSNGIDIVNLNYSLNKQDNHELRLRSKVDNRPLTEAFIIDLESINFFSEIESPLSNLIGKGERFVNIDFVLDIRSIMDSYLIKEAEGKKVSEEENEPNLPAEPQEEAEGATEEGADENKTNIN